MQNHSRRDAGQWIGPDGTVFSDGQIEHGLVEGLRVHERAVVRAMVDLVHFYHRTGQRDREQDYVDRFINGTDDLEERAGRFLVLGIAMEAVQDFAAAASSYRQGLALEPGDRDMWYFLQNNLGYSLNQLGQFERAEEFCQRAIGVDPARHNAHKNLGIALAGQGEYAGAIESLVSAIERCPQDPRALQHLEEMLANHPEFLERNEGLCKKLARCRVLVQKGQEGARPV